ncbi:Os12g0513250 [Oryza sativa Japonica Group]|uniref:Os12g0513250 protein n=1 Tax=Oryza sativa subsp. japonica TaxID=39947 RepID=A0A0P0YAP5_ORYSJ|nr:Os12g0513250 [Oryza sativa Japonica Group]
MFVLILSASRVTQRWREESHQGVQAGGVEEPPLFEAECVHGRIEMRAKKRKRERELLRIALEGAIVESPQAVPISVRGADLESGEGSSDSVTSDAGSAKAAADDVVHIAHALCKVCAKSPKAVNEFVRRVSPATVGRSIDWDLVRDNDSSKMSDRRHRWTDMEVRVFLESCLEEMAAYNITSNSPKP